jgi:hypothetical protein
MVTMGGSERFSASVQTANSIGIYAYPERIDCIAFILHMYTAFHFFYENKVQIKVWLLWLFKFSLFRPPYRCFVIFRSYAEIL